MSSSSCSKSNGCTTSKTMIDDDSSGVAPPPPPLLQGLLSSLGRELITDVTHRSRILLIGAGGIGCEVLKNLALCGFRHVHVIDLDTIDVSNLNRQLLFRPPHVGQAKCVVACRVAAQFVPPTDDKKGVEYKPHYMNVCDGSKFNTAFVRQFDVVLGALDNVEARRRVNRLCVATSVPLVEAGTTGYLGQCTVVHKPSEVECYECTPKPTPKVFPICTIRSTPTKPVHTIVWAKELYKLILGPQVEASMLFEQELAQDEEHATDQDKKPSADSATTNGDNEDKDDNDDDLKLQAGEKSTYMDSVRELRSLILDKDKKSQSEDIRSKACEVMDKLYGVEIQKQLDMNRYKAATKVPQPLYCSQRDTSAITPPCQQSSYTPQSVWTLEECVAEWVAVLEEASLRKESLLPSFDKDNELCLRFVTATANLRSHVFDIQPAFSSLYTVKGIAGNIIPAIATTNAIVAGLQVLQVFWILRQRLEKQSEALQVSEQLRLKETSCRYVYCRREPTRQKYYLVPSQLPPPNPDCFVCRNAKIYLQLDLAHWTLQKFLTRILKGPALGFQSPSIMLGSSVIYEEGDDDEDVQAYRVNLPKGLTQLPAGGVAHGSILHVEDFTQDLQVDIIVQHTTDWKKANGKDDNNDDEEEQDQVKDEDRFHIGGTLTKKPPPPPASAVAKAAPEQKDNDNNDEDDVCMIVDAPATKEDVKVAATKRKRRASHEEQEPPRKMAATIDLIDIDD